MKKSCILLITLFFVCVISLWSQINTDRVLAIGRNALFFEDYVLSIQYFNQVIKSKPYLAEPYLYRAMAKYSLDDFKGAEDDITLCVERNPFLVYAYQYRGSARQSLENFKGAIEDYDKGLEFHPEDKQMLINKGIAYIQLKDYEGAEQTLNQLLKLQPKFVQAYLTRGAMYTEKGDTLKAISDYNTSIELDKYFAPAYGHRGLLYFQQENLKGALADFNEAVRLDPKFVGYYINRGLVSYHLNDLRGAMADFDAVIKLEPNNQVTRFNRGLLCAQVGDASRAIEDFDNVIRQEPDNFMAIYNRALLHDEIGKYNKAVADLNLVMKEYPNFVSGFYYRAEVKRKMHDIKGADTDYWHAYHLEQKLAKEKEKGKKITGKEVLDAGQDATANTDDKTREKSDKDIGKFNRLVVYDKEEQQESQYNDEIRGRVQDRQVKVDLEPLFVITYYERIEVLKNISFFDKFITDYNQKMVLSRQLKITNKEAALTDDQADFHFKSINDYSLTLEKDSSNTNALFGRAMDYMVLQDLSESIKDLNRVLSLDPNFIMAYFNRAVIRLKQIELESYNTYNKEDPDLTLNIRTGNKKPTSPYVSSPIQENSAIGGEKKNLIGLEQITRDYDMVVKLNPNFVYAYFNRANLRCSQKDFKSAILDYNEAINRDVDFAEAYFNRGLARLHTGDNQRGIADLSKAGELGIVDAYSIIKRMIIE